MKKFAILAAAGVFAITGAAQADTAAQRAASDASDHAAVAKDDAALAKQQGNMAVNRVEKAHAKATGDTGAQLQNSAELAGNHVAVGEKKVEKSIDKAVLDNNDTHSK